MDRQRIADDPLKLDNLPNADGRLKIVGPLKLDAPLIVDALRTTADPLRVDHPQTADALLIVADLLIVATLLRVHHQRSRSRVSKRIVADPKDPRLNVRRVRLHRLNASPVQCNNDHRPHGPRLRNSNVRKLNASRVRYNNGRKPSVPRLRNSSNVRKASA